MMTIAVCTACHINNPTAVCMASVKYKPGAILQKNIVKYQPQTIPLSKKFKKNDHIVDLKPQRPSCISSMFTIVLQWHVPEML